MMLFCLQAPAQTYVNFLHSLNTVINKVVSTWNGQEQRKRKKKKKLKEDDCEQITGFVTLCIC